MGAIPLKAVTNPFPREEENPTSEASGVVFDPTIGEGGVETPLHNDSSKASFSPPVGSRLRSFKRDWLTNKCSQNVLNIITNGYVLPFRSKPNLIRFPLILSEYKAQQKNQALATCIQSLLSKNAIERVENVNSLGFYSRLFLVPKPHQRWRPVIDLSRLNTFLHVEKFKMETPESIRTSLVPGEWVSSIDLSDAYLHIPIHPNSRKYLRFCYKAQVFQFTSLPFGLATAPQVFTMIVKEVKQTILLCYKQADQQALDLVQVKAHDIRAFAASKAFYGGVSVDQIMQACHWKAHNTFTNFYLKDLTWSDTDNNMYLGPVVAAQQVLDPSPQTSCPRKEKRGGGAHPLQPSLQESLPGSRYSFTFKMLRVRSFYFSIIR